jgi:hypothetical protein
MTPAFYQIKERSLRELIRDIYNLIKSIIISIYNFLVWAYNKIKVKKLRGHKKATTIKPEQKPASSKDVGRSETLACWKCQQSVPIAEYSGHVDKCVLQKPQFRV